MKVAELTTFGRMNVIFTYMNFLFDQSSCFQDFIRFYDFCYLVPTWHDSADVWCRGWDLRLARCEIPTCWIAQVGWSIEDYDIPMIFFHGSKQGLI